MKAKPNLKALHFVIVGLILAPFLLYFYDIGNTGGLRQGTEGFYLQIVAEMKAMGTMLVPYHSGVPHFSKPPLGFWLALPLVEYLNLDILFGARLAILLSSLGLFFLIARSVARNLHYNWAIVLIFTLATFGAVKYSRIFMLESPLALLGTLAGLWLYEGLKGDNLWRSLFAGVALGLAGLTKGPVSFVMAGLSLVIYFLLEWRLPKKREWQHFILALVAALVVFLPWFLILGARFGSDFWNYFLVRENLGKFSTKSYPITVLFQGLFLFLLPWSLLFLSKIKGVNHRWLKCKKSERAYLVYLFAFGLGHFLIWFIPSQRSHHYAYPSTFFFLYLILPLTGETLGLKRLILLMMALLYFIIAYLSLTFSYPYLLPLLLAILALGFVIKGRTRYFTPLWALALLCLWYVIAPRYALPIMPENIQTRIGTKDISVAVRKPFFISEELGRDIVIVPQHKVSSTTVRTSLLLADHVAQKNFAKLPDYEVIATYEVWKRGARFGEILSAIKARDLSALKTPMFLLQRVD